MSIGPIDPWTGETWEQKERRQKEGAAWMLVVLVLAGVVLGGAGLLWLTMQAKIHWSNNPDAVQYRKAHDIR